MTFTKATIAAVAGALTLGACTDPGMLGDPADPNRNRNQGVLLGAGLGAVVGNLTGGDTKATVAGAVLGGVAGGLVGTDPGVVFHKAVPDLDIVVAVHDHNADINALHDVEQPVEFVDIDVFGHL